MVTVKVLDWPAIVDACKPPTTIVRQSVSFVSTETSPEKKFDTATSGNVSPLKLPTTTASGPDPPLQWYTALNVPSPLPISTVGSILTTVMSGARASDTTTSSLPSPLKSPV